MPPLITLERDPEGAFIICCLRCGSVEMGLGQHPWQECVVKPQQNSLAWVSCIHCNAETRMQDPRLFNSAES